MHGGVSIIIPAYNRPDLVVEAVRSALGQTIEDIEVLVIDDGSVPPLSLAMFPADERLRLIRSDENRKAASARNLGLEAAGKRWIAFLDSDDVWLPNKLERQLERVGDLPAARPLAIATGWTYVGEDHRRISLTPRGASELVDFASGCWFCPGSTVLMSRAHALSVGPQDTSLTRLEDFDWFLRFSQMGGVLEVVTEPLVEIRWHRSLNVEAVASASRVIEEKFCSPVNRLFLASPAVRRRLRSYLALTLASAAWYNGRRALALAALARSWLLRPRWTAQLARWWIEPKDPRRPDLADLRDDIIRR